MTKREVIQILKSEISREGGIPVAEIADGADFFSLGLDSISCVYVLDRVEKKIKIELNPIYFWDYPTVETLSCFIASITEHES
jgi:acyl carrier protein